MKKQSDYLKRAGIVLLMSFSTSAVFAAGIASEQVDTGGLTLLPTVSYDSATLRVSSDSSDTTSSYTAGDGIRVNAGNLADGVYSYELSLNTKPAEDSPDGGGSSVSQNGGFEIVNGAAKAYGDVELNAQAEAERLQVLASQPASSESE